ncbi:MAG: GAF domain-containing protein [Thermincola sp.]|jgi:purine catabolism regulator|nr:GAF domain-containing protein [Thermincola sp.]MDT3702595.1 GAF domain-containing protein [Thermincola sp.]
MGKNKEQVITMEAFHRQVANRNIQDSVASPTSSAEHNLVLKINELINKLKIILDEADNLNRPVECVRLCLQEFTGTELFERAEAMLYLANEDCLLETAEPEEYIIPPEINAIRYELLERAKTVKEAYLLNNGLGKTGVLTIPITCFREFYGVVFLYLSSKELPISSPSFLMGIKYLGDLLGNYVRFHKVHKKHTSTHHRLISLQGAVQKVSTNLNQPKALTEIVKLAAETVNAKYAWLSLVKKETMFLSPDAFVGLDLEYLNRISVTIDDSITAKGPSGKAIKTKSPQLIPDTQIDLDFAPWRDLTAQLGYRSILAVPILFNDTVLGMIAVYSSSVNAFNSEDIEILQSFANFSAVIINHASLFDEYEQKLYDEQRMHRQVESQNQLLKRSQKLLRELSRILLSRQSIDEIVDSVAGLLQNPILVEDRMGVLSWKSDSLINDAPFSKHPDFTGDKRILLEQQQPILLCANSSKGYHHDHLVGPIILENEVWGYISIVAAEQRICEVDWMVLDKAATIMAAALAKEKSKFEIEQQMGCGFLANLCDQEKSNKEIIKQGAYLGFDLQKSFYSMVIDLDNSQIEKSSGQKLLKLQAIKSLKDYLDSYFGSSLLTWDERVVVILVRQGSTPLEGHLLNGLVTAIRHCLNPVNQKKEVTIVNCGLLKGISDFRSAFLEAADWIELAQILDRRGELFSIGDLNIYVLIYKIYKKEGLNWLENLVQSQLAKLLAYDRSNVLIETLFGFMETDKQIQRAAEKLYIHPNTMSYRLKKAEDFLGVSLDSLDNSEKVFFALRGHKLLLGLKKYAISNKTETFLGGN